MGRKIMLRLKISVLMFLCLGAICRGTKAQETRASIYYREADGINGSYRSLPKVQLVHEGPNGVLNYTLHNSNGYKKGQITEIGSGVVLKGSDFCEGNNQLTLWMEEGGREISGSRMTRSFYVDTGTNDNVEDNIAAGEIENIENLSYEVTLPQMDSAKIAPPNIKIENGKKWQISNEPITIKVSASSEEPLKKAKLFVAKQDDDGKNHNTAKEQEGEKDAVFEQLLDKDGIYQITIHAEDFLGQTKEEKVQAIVDTKPPRILDLGLEEEGRIKEFCLGQNKEDLVEDFTGTSVTVWIDGMIYTLGNTIKKEGRHKLLIEATDMAGNQSRKELFFMIDHTPPVIDILGVTQDAVYSRKVKITIKTQEESQITEIRLNGKLKKADDKGRLVVDKAGKYAMKVHVKDKAGNEAIKDICFSVQGGKEPIKELTNWLTRSIEKDGQHIKIGIMTGGFVVAVVVIILKRRKKEC